MRLTVFLSLLVAAGLIACSSSLLQSGACHDSSGDKVTHVWDAQDKQWPIEKVEGDAFGQELAFCGVSLKGAAYVDTKREGRMGPFPDQALYFTDEAGEVWYRIKVRGRGEFVFDWVGPERLQWY